MLDKINDDKQVLVLLPEIGLTHEFEKKFIDITDIFDNEIFKDRTPSLINKGVIRLINNNTSPTIEVKVTTPINLSKNAKIFNCNSQLNCFLTVIYS